MNRFYIFILFSLALELIIILMTSHKIKDKIQPMHGMVLTMTFATNIGLTIGVLFGSYFQGNLFAATFISILLGMTTGLLCGNRFGLFSSIEGVMAGMMAGMMGAMFGEMIQTHQAVIAMNIFLLLSICSLILFLILPIRVNTDTDVNSKWWFIKPLFIMILISSYLLLGFQLSSGLIKSKSPSQHHHM